MIITIKLKNVDSKTPHFELGNDYDEMHLFANEQEGASRLKKVSIKKLKSIEN